MKYEAIITLTKSEADVIRNYMDNEPKDESKALVDDHITHTAVFANGYSMDVSCCGVSFFDDEPDAINTAWGEGVLFDKHGNEVASDVAEGSDELLDTWTLCDRNNEYVTTIIIKED